MDANRAEIDSVGQKWILPLRELQPNVGSENDMEIMFNGRLVSVKQLTVRQVNDLLEAKTEPPTTADFLMDKDFPEAVVRLSTGLTTEELNTEALPTELAELWDAVGEVNHFLEKLLRRLNAAGRKIVEEEVGKSAVNSSEK